MDDDTGSGSSSRPSLVRAQAALPGMRARRRLKDIPEVKRHQIVQRSLDLGMSAAPSITHLGTRLTRAEREQVERERDHAAGIAEE